MALEVQVENRENFQNFGLAELEVWKNRPPRLKQEALEAAGLELQQNFHWVVLVAVVVRFCPVAVSNR